MGQPSETRRMLSVPHFRFLATSSSRYRWKSKSFLDSHSPSGGGNRTAAAACPLQPCSPLSGTLKSSGSSSYSFGVLALRHHPFVAQVRSRISQTFTTSVVFLLSLIGFSAFVGALCRETVSPSDSLFSDVSDFSDGTGVFAAFLSLTAHGPLPRRRYQVRRLMPIASRAFCG